MSPDQKLMLGVLLLGGAGLSLTTSFQENISGITTWAKNLFSKSEDKTPSLAINDRNVHGCVQEFIEYFQSDSDELGVKLSIGLGRHLYNKLEETK